MRWHKIWSGESVRGLRRRFAGVLSCTLVGGVLATVGGCAR
jgi:hypothetical protein